MRDMLRRVSTRRQQSVLLTCGRDSEGSTNSRPWAGSCTEYSMASTNGGRSGRSAGAGHVSHKQHYEQSYSPCTSTGALDYTQLVENACKLRIHSLDEDQKLVE